MTEPRFTGVRGRSPRPLYLPATLLRILGAALLLCALLLPWGYALRRARLLPPPPGQTRALRPELLVLPANLRGQPPRRSFALATGRITQGHFSAALDQPPPPADQAELPQRPADLAAAQRYCDRLSDLEGWPRCPPGTSECLGYRLPQREEMAYAARADQERPAAESPNAWGLSDLEHPERLLHLGQATPAATAGFLIARTCPAPPRPCARNKP